jgi:hypothetical protein
MDKRNSECTIKPLIIEDYYCRALLSPFLIFFFPRRRSHDPPFPPTQKKPPDAEVDKDPLSLRRFEIERVLNKGIYCGDGGETFRFVS